MPESLLLIKNNLAIPGFCLLIDNLDALLYRSRHETVASGRFNTILEKIRRMAELKEVVEDENKIDTVIAEDIVFRGSLKFKNSLKIKGSLEGKIETEGQLIVGREAKVSADVRTGEFNNSGVFNGKIKATKKIELFKKSKTYGDVITPELNIESGSIFNGTCIMEEK